LHDDDLAGAAAFNRLILQAKSPSSEDFRRPILERHGRHVLRRKEPQADRDSGLRKQESLTDSAMSSSD
jgi:hypothetical protein